MAAVASGLQIMKRMRVDMRGTVLGSTPVQKRAAVAQLWPENAPAEGLPVTAEWRSCDRGGGGQALGHRESIGSEQTA